MRTEFGETMRIDTQAGRRARGAPLLNDWIEQAKQGDGEAWRALVTAYRAQVFRTAWRLLGNREDALDASQEVFMRMHAYLHRFDARRELGPWLYRVTVNVSRDIGRKRRRFARMDAEPTSNDVAVGATAPRRLDAESDREVLERGLRTLSEGERTALVLRDIEGLTTKEVANVTGVKEVTVRTLISRARVKLRAYRRKALRSGYEL